jgi:CRISPR-associated protein Cst1
MITNQHWAMSNTTNNIHRIYLRDWYFNAGIAGFVRLVGRANITLGTHYIEFGNEVLEGFEDKLRKEVFLTYFKIEPYLGKLRKVKEDAQKEIENPKSKATPKKLSDPLTKFPYKGLSAALNLPFETAETMQDLIDAIEKNSDYFSNHRTEHIYQELQQNDATEYLSYFIELKLKGFCSLKDLSKIIEKTTAISYQDKALKPAQRCISCQDEHRKAEFELSNAVSNIMAFNGDNANWIWGYKSTHVRLCPICTLMYISTIAGFLYTTIVKDGDWLDCYYFANQNTSLEALLGATELLKTSILEERSRGTSFYQMVKSLMTEIKQTQADYVDQGLHIIEVVQNPILGGQSSKGYNIYNYVMSPSTATFIKNNINSLPKGYYKTKDTSIDIQMELLQKMIHNTLTKQDLAHYARYRVQDLNKSLKSSGFSLGQVVKICFAFWNSQQKGEKNMSERPSEKIYSNGFSAGVELKKELQTAKRTNQIPGLAHSFLNSLKIEDRNQFLDEYFRLVMRYNIPMRVFKQEMTQMDDFLQFGYAFLAGLISDERNKDEGEKNQGAES